MANYNKTEEDSLSFEDEPIDFSLVYALHTFVANLEGQVCALKGDSLELLDDSNSYWWLVKCIKTDEIGYIPAENVETPFERLARMNKTKNVRLASTMESDIFSQGLKENKIKKNVIFPDNFVEYIEDYDVEDYEEEVQQDTSKKSGSTSRNLFNKLISKTSSISTASIDRIKAGTAALKRTTSPITGSLKDLSNSSSNSLNSPKAISPVGNNSSSTILVSPTDSFISRQINVLHVYAGNTDLKANFKSVSISSNMTAQELLIAALKKFRVPLNTANAYYLSILHMDSQERKLEPSDDISAILEELKHKNLPGIGTSAALISGVSMTPDGEVINVNINDDKVIKVLINKSGNQFDKDYRLVRIFMYDEADPSRSTRTYKTLGVRSIDTVGVLKQLAIAKFKLATDSNYKFKVFTLSRGEQFPCNDDVPIFQLLSTLDSDQDLVLGAEWIGRGEAPTQFLEGSFGKAGPLLMDDIKSLLNSKPEFLDIVPALGTSLNIPFLKDDDSLLGHSDSIISGIPTSNKHCSTSVDLDTLRSENAKWKKAEEEKRQQLSSAEVSPSLNARPSISHNKDSSISFNIGANINNTSDEALTDLDKASAFFMGVDELNPATTAAFDQLLRETASPTDINGDDFSSFLTSINPQLKEEGHSTFLSQFSDFTGGSKSNAVVSSSTGSGSTYAGTAEIPLEGQIYSQSNSTTIKRSNTIGSQTSDMSDTPIQRSRQGSFNLLNPTHQSLNAGFYTSLRGSQYGRSSTYSNSSKIDNEDHYITKSGDSDRAKNRPRSTFDTMEEYLEEHINGCQNREKLGKLEEEINNIRLHSVVKGPTLS